MNTEKIKIIISKFLFKSLIVAVITLVLLIVMKTNVSFKTNFYKYVYDTNLSFAKFDNLYNKYFKDFKINNISDKETLVSDEKITYKSKEEYNGGLKLEVSKNYSVPAQDSGIIVFIGKKENFGNTIIVQQVDGIDVWYGNIDNTNYKLYDYVKKKDILGTSNNYLYLLYKKDGKIINYEKYI